MCLDLRFVQGPAYDLAFVFQEELNRILNRYSALDTLSSYGIPPHTAHPRTHGVRVRLTAYPRTHSVHLP